jgi:hypothetical protein
MVLQMREVISWFFEKVVEQAPISQKSDMFI